MTFLNENAPALTHLPHICHSCFGHTVVIWCHSVMSTNVMTYVKQFGRESADELTDGNTERRTDGNTGPILLPRSLTREVKKIRFRFPFWYWTLQVLQCQQLINPHKNHNNQIWIKMIALVLLSQQASTVIHACNMWLTRTMKPASGRLRAMTRSLSHS